MWSKFSKTKYQIWLQPYQISIIIKGQSIKNDSEDEEVISFERKLLNSKFKERNEGKEVK